MSDKEMRLKQKLRYANHELNRLRRWKVEMQEKIAHVEEVELQRDMLLRHSMEDLYQQLNPYKRVDML